MTDADVTATVDCSLTPALSLWPADGSAPLGVKLYYVALFGSCNLFHCQQA